MGRLLLAALLMILARAEATAAEVPSFRADVMPVLSRAGCNAGACHGNLHGKGGFKLSLRGEDPIGDLRSLSRDGAGRRTDRAWPEESLILLKATGRESHDGGVRFSNASPEHAILRAWIAAGMADDPANSPKPIRLEVLPKSVVAPFGTDEVKLTVVAHLSDGSTKNVLPLMAFDTTTLGTAEVHGDGTIRRVQDGETVVIIRYRDLQVAVPVAFLADRPNFKPATVSSDNPIDRLLGEQWNALKITPAAECDDATFVRRLTLDTAGRIPTADEARAFIADGSQNKRAALIDRLLASDGFAEHWASKWGDLLRNEEKTLDPKGVRLFYSWLRENAAADRPWTEQAHDILSARGSSYADPETNFYRAIREPYARAESAAQVFLGVRMQCAKCHNHPFDIWSQDDYHSFAALFARVNYRLVENNRRDNFDKHEFVGEQFVIDDRSKELKHPNTGETTRPKLLGGAFADPDDRLGALADWVAAPDNPFFARAMANRIWSHLMGRGLVEPNDDFRATNPASNEELLGVLAAEFRKHGFRLKPLARLILTSRAYGRSARAADQPVDDGHFSQAVVAPLKAESLLDALGQVFDSPAKFAGYRAGIRAGNLPAPLGMHSARPESAERFLKAFGKPERLMSCDCERSHDPGMIQAFQLLNGPVVQKMLAESNNRVGKLLARNASDGEAVEELFLAALSRLPTDAEKKALGEMISRRENRREAVEDVAWSLINSKEFLLRR